MTVELLRRLLDGGAPLPPIEAALLSEVEARTSFVRALAERSPELTPLVERELERAGVAEIHVVRASTELSRLLPAGMCERLMAVPVFRDPQGGRVDVAAVNALDPHLAQEFGFQLKSKVRILRASSGQIRAALEVLANASSPTSTRGRRITAPPDSPSTTSAWLRPPSDAPIPLVRRPNAEEPVLNLTRSKGGGTRPPFAFGLDSEQAVLEIGRAESPEAVAHALCAGLEPAVALVAAVRAKSFEARAASAALGADTRGFSLPSHRNSVFDLALEHGFYLGPLPGTVVHAELRALLAAAAHEEVYVAPVLVADRPALVVLMAGFGPALEATRRADRLIEATVENLERILRSRKAR